MALALLAVLVVAAAPAAARRAPNAVESELLQRINDQRAAMGRKALTADSRLAAVASGNSLRMATTGALIHSPYARILRAVNGRRAGEAIAVGSSAAQIVAAWMASPVHRSIVLGRGFRLAGVGVAPGAAAWYATLDVAG
jgi:uncharacterized protein YkwD